MEKGAANSARPATVEVHVKETVRHTEYTVIHSVYPYPEQVYLIEQPKEQAMGFLGWLGVVVLFCFVMMATTCVMAQSNVRQFYGWGDYGANGTYRGPQSEYPTPREQERPRFNYLPVPIQPQQEQIVCRREILEYNMRPSEREWITCYWNKQVLRYCRPSDTACYDTGLWDPKTYVMTGK